MLFSLGALGRLQLKDSKTLAAFSEIIHSLGFSCCLSPHCPPFPLISLVSPVERVCQCRAPLFPFQISPSGPSALKIQHLPFHALGHLSHHTWDPRELSPSLPFTSAPSYSFHRYTGLLFLWCLPYQAMGSRRARSVPGVA